MLRKKKKIVTALVWFIFFAVLGGFFYVNDFYHSDLSVQNYMQSNELVTVTKIEEGLYLDGMGEEDALIFYPGAKVEYTAYLPILYQLAEQGVDCFLIEMPCNLAVFGMDKAEKILDRYEYPHWYLSGHSLGGAMAASYVSKKLDRFCGLILLAAYPTKSLKGELFSVLSVYGSEDGVLDRKKLEEGRNYMPADYTEVCIEGGNHAWFGNYGKQKGDGNASVSVEEQQRQTVEVILRMIMKK